MRNFDKSYMDIAEIWAKNSYALKYKVGAIIVKDNQIISDGFNGTPAGFENECEDIECKANLDPLVCSINKACRDNTDNYDLFGNIDESQARLACYNCKCEYCYLHTKDYVLHAEANAITKLAKTNNSAKGATLYITLSPCINCAKLIIQAGIRRVVYKDSYKHTDGIELLKRAGIIVEQLK